jgi:endonuclease/exonuclease/phosphatase family metal-dependent hydrolase
MPMKKVGTEGNKVVFLSHALALALLFSLAALGQQVLPLVETGEFAERGATPPDRLKIVSYNIHGPQKDDVEELFNVLEQQEVNRYRRKTGPRNIARELAERLKMNYVYAVENTYPESKGGGARGLAILSRLPLSDIERLELPHRGPGGRRRIGLLATINAGATAIRLCNVHLETRLANEKKAEQMRLILSQLKHNSPTQKTIVLGDFNTIKDSTRQTLAGVLEQVGFKTPFQDNVKTFRRSFLVRLKLDWIYLNDLHVVGHKVEADVTASDHRPIWVEIDVSRGMNE